MSEMTLPAGAARPGKPHNHFKITVRTLAGHSLKDTGQAERPRVRGDRPCREALRRQRSAGRWELRAHAAADGRLGRAGPDGHAGRRLRRRRRRAGAGQPQAPGRRLMTLHPLVLADLLDAEVELARDRLGERAFDLRREGDALLMSLVRPVGSSQPRGEQATCLRFLRQGRMLREGLKEGCQYMSHSGPIQALDLFRVGATFCQLGTK